MGFHVGLLTPMLIGPNPGRDLAFPHAYPHLPLRAKVSIIVHIYHLEVQIAPILAMAPVLDRMIYVVERGGIATHEVQE